MSSDAASPPQLLIADDQADVLTALRLLFKPEGYRIDAVTSPSAVLQYVAEREYDAALVDLNYTRDTTSGREGLDLLTKMRAIDSTLGVIVMTAWSSVELAVDAMRRGARDFVEKPWANERLLSIVRTQTELTRALRQGQRLGAELDVLQKNSTTPVIAQSRSMEPVLQLVARVSDADANVLVTGENGTGKGLLARVLHQPGLGVADSVGSLTFSPSGFGNAGHMKVISYNGNTQYDLSLTPDGSGTYNFSPVTASVPTVDGPEGIALIHGGNRDFPQNSALVSQYHAGIINAYGVDANGNLIADSEVPFITGLPGAEGAAIDPITGDFLFSTYGAGDHIIAVHGFIAPFLPADFNNSGTVDFSDLLILAQHYGTISDALHETGDANRDGA